MTPGKEDGVSIDATLGALYEAISFPAGSEPDWDRLRSLFLTDGSLTPPKDPDEPSVHVMGIEAFIHRAKKRIASNKVLQERGFQEREIARRVDRFANIAHVLSVYEGRFGGADGELFARGINSVQLLEEEGCWKVVSIMWADEDAVNRIPARYLGED